MLHLLDHDPLFIRLCCAALVGAVQKEEFWGKLQNFTIISPVDGLICFDINAWCFLTVAVVVAVSVQRKDIYLMVRKERHQAPSFEIF